VVPPSSHPVSTGPSRGRHRAVAPRRGTRRAAMALVAAGAPLLPAALLAAPAQADTDWDELAQCESSGNWSINTGNGFSGGLQFTPSTWKAFGGSGQAEDASREQQIAVAERVKAAQGMNAWPTCSKKTGNTDSSPNEKVSTVSTPRKAEKAQKGKAQKAPKHAAPSRAGGTYTVKAGDTLSSIAAAHGTDWRSVQSANQDVITDPNMILPGQSLAL
jgi:resuscitation-promoting factor RpfA